MGPCRDTIQRYLRHREEVLRQVGDDFLGGRVADAAERRDHVKALFNSFDMDGTLGAWRGRMGLRDGERPSAGMVIDLGPDGQFDFEAHRRAQRVGTAWLAERRRAMTAFVGAHLRNERDTRRLEHPERTVASYIFQEAEGVSRKVKAQLARVQGHTVHNLQHDGVILRLDWGEAPQRVAQQLSAVTAHALGYAQPVKVKS